MKRWLTVALSVLLTTLGACGPTEPEIVVGSKNFTESVILGEMLRILASGSGAVTRHQRALGGTRLVFSALASGEIDAYVEYTGTLIHEIFASDQIDNQDELRSKLAERGITLAGPLGFQNNYALGVPETLAAKKNIRTLSDLRAHPELVMRFSSEFMQRADGWPGLKKRYRLPQQDALGIEHDLAYRAIASGDADVTDLYTTDAEIAYYKLRALRDDLGYFPRFDAVLLYRTEMDMRAPAVVTALRHLLGVLDEKQMTELNARVKLQRQNESKVAADFLHERLDIGKPGDAAGTPGLAARLWLRTTEHLVLVGVSLLAAIAIAIPLGISATRHPRLGQLVLGLVGVAQTIPALALLVFMIPLFGIGAAPALAALFLYSLLPIVRNTFTGITGIPASLIESAEALGLSRNARLWHIELPLALPTIMAGIKTAAVINVGAATLGALVGAGGYGQPILTGIRLDNTALILEGAVPAAVLALAVQWLFDRAEHALVPRGIRRHPSARPGAG